MKQLPHKRSVARLVLWLSIISSSHATAACYSGHPDVHSERRDSEFVILGKVVASKDVASEDDADYIGQTDYTVALLHAYKGSPGRHIKITSVNTSTRFPMDTGKTYLLFVIRATDGSYFVDSCGNSGAAIDKRGVVAELE
jgi:hypothetical protein